MILEVLRLVGDWLNDGTNGVTAQLTAMQVGGLLDAGDVAPAVGTIADESRNELVAQSFLPSTPGIGVNVQDMSEMDGEVSTYTRDGKATLIVRYGVSATAQKNAVRDSSYVLRAVVRSIRLFNATTRTRNGVDVYSCLSLSYFPLWKPTGDMLFTGGVRVQFQYRDNQP